METEKKIRTQTAKSAGKVEREAGNEVEKKTARKTVEKTESGSVTKKGRSSDRNLGQKSVKEYLGMLLYPPRCVLCDEVIRISDGGCCEDCRSSLPYIKEPRCMKCGKPVESEETEYCDDCRKYPHDFDRGTAPFTYTGRMRRSVYRMKSQNRRDYIAFYAEAMAETVQRYQVQWRPQLLIPVPMHRGRKRVRGYNQAELLAGQLSMLLDIPMDTQILRCVKKAAAQKQLNRKERQKNLQGSFAAVQPLHGIERVVLVDDVYTTGSTLDEASRVLKAVGVRQVFFVVLCTGKGKKGSMHIKKNVV